MMEAELEGKQPHNMQAPEPPQKLEKVRRESPLKP